MKRTLLVALLALASCRSEPTQLVVLVDSDLNVPDPLMTVRARVLDDRGTERFLLDVPLSGSSAATLPLSFGVLPAGGDPSRRLTIEVSALDAASSVLVKRTARTELIEGRTVLLGMFLAADCRGVVCADGQTCTENGCESDLIDPTTLAPVAPGQEVDHRFDVTDAGARDGGVSDGDSRDGGGPDVSPIDVGVPIDSGPKDVGPQRILPSVSALTIIEGGSGVVQVSLSECPTGDVVVDAVLSDPASLSAVPAQLVFTAANFDRAQDISVLVADDFDLEGATEQLTLTSTDVDPVSVDLTIIDDDSQAIEVIPFAIRLTEGSSTSISVRLAYAPAAAASITLASSNPTALSVSPSQLVFTPEDYDQPRSIDVIALNDDDLESETATIAFVGAGAAMTARVDVMDDDMQNLILNVSRLPLVEGRSGQFTARLAHAPAQPLTVSVMSSASEVVVDTVGIVFDSSNYDVPMTITVTASDDEDLESLLARVTLTAAGLSDATVQVPVSDDDVQRLIASPTSLAVTEGDVTQFSLRLAFRPATVQVLTVRPSDPSAATVMPATYSIDPADYDVPRVFTVEGLSDADAADERLDLMAAIDLSTTLDIPLTIVDDESLSIVTAPASLSLAEGGSVMMDVRLSAAPTSATTVMIDAGPLLQAQPAMVVFSPSNFDQPQSVLIRAIQDPDAEDETTTMTLSAAGVTAIAVPVSIDDDEEQAIVAADTLSMLEATSSLMPVSLRFAPRSTVTVGVAVASRGKLRATPTTLTFSAGSTGPINLVLDALPDADLVDDSVLVTLSASGLSTTIQVSIDDDDTQMIVMQPASLSVAEGATANLGVALMFAPSSTVQVNVESVDTSIARPGVSVLTFTPANYDQLQNVVIIAPNDIDALDEITIISASLTGVRSSAEVRVLDDECPAPRTASTPDSSMSFFVTSVGNGNHAGDYGGFAGADERCQCLATVVGAGDRTWRAYLSALLALDNSTQQLTSARDRIGVGPWFNYQGNLIAADVASLHATPPSSTMIIDEYGQGVPTNETGILTGSARDGSASLPAHTTTRDCDGWRARLSTHDARIGRSDWSDRVGNASWNSETDLPCNLAGLQSGESTGRLYCFATN